MGFFSNMCDAALSLFIKEREKTGATGRTDATLHAANCEQTDRLSTEQIATGIEERDAQGLPTDKLRAAAQARFSGHSDAELSSYIKQREATGATGRTDAMLHAANCAQTDRLSTGDIRSLIAERQAQGLPTRKLEAALENRDD